MHDDKNNDHNLDAVQVFEELCVRSETVDAFVAVALDPEGLVSVGSMGLDHSDILSVLEKTVEFLRAQWKLHESNQQSEENDNDSNPTLH